MSRMFSGMVTWNPGYGCPDHKCPYCWVPNTICRRGDGRGRKFKAGEVFLDDVKLREGPPKAPVVFVWAHGDMWSQKFPYFERRDVIVRLQDTSDTHPDTRFVFFTKNPLGYLEFFQSRPNFMDGRFEFGVTIETNRDLGPDVMGHAPGPYERFMATILFKNAFPGAKILLSIEPVMDFDEDKFLTLICNLSPHTTYIGYDNHHHHLPEPSKEEVLRLIKNLRINGLNVVEKTIREGKGE